MTNSAAMFVRDSGSTTSQKKRIGPAPSIFAASTSSSGIVRKNWRKSRVAGGGGHERHDEAGHGVDELEVHHDLEGRDDADLDRQHEGDEDQPEADHAAGEGEEHHGIGRQQRDHDLPDRDQHGHVQAVPQHDPDRDAERGARLRAAGEPGRDVVRHRLPPNQSGTSPRPMVFTSCVEPTTVIQMGKAKISTPSPITICPIQRLRAWRRAVARARARSSACGRASAWGGAAKALSTRRGERVG